MKGFCHVWSRGRHFSPSLPGDRYLKLGSKSDLRAEISGSIVRYDALAPRPGVLLIWYFVGACTATLELKFFLFVEKISTYGRLNATHLWCHLLGRFSFPNKHIWFRFGFREELMRTITRFQRSENQRTVLFPVVADSQRKPVLKLQSGTYSQISEP